MRDMSRTIRFATLPVPLPSREGLGEGCVALLMGVIVAFASALDADVIQLRSSVTTDATQITLKDVAILEGVDVERLADFPVMKLADSQAQRSITAEELRRLLDDQGVHWGKITLRGASSVTVRRLITPTAAPVKTAANPITPTVADPAVGTLRQRIIDWIKQNITADESDLKISFDEEQAALLDATVGDRLEFEPMTRDVLGRIPLVIRRYRQDLLASTMRVRVDVQLRRMAVAVKRTLNRGQLIGSDDVELKAIWCESVLKQPATDPAAVIGKKMGALTHAGGVIYTDDLQGPAVIKRGDKVMVRCVSGSIVVRAEGRAVEEGSVGSVIAIKREIREKNRTVESTFAARISGPGEAVMVADSLDGAAPSTEGHR